MNVLLFSHEPDIDGLGSIILGKIAFENLTFVLCQNNGLNGINEIFQKYYTDEIYKYDLIYFTDIGLSKENIEIIQGDIKLKDKIYMFDHHISQDGISNKYSWVQILFEKDTLKCCGTSLFYEYLLKNDMIKRTPAIDEFVELTRQYDTWDWKANNNIKSYKLNLLFNSLGKTQYINSLYYKLITLNTEFYFNELEEKLIELEQLKINEYVQKSIENIIIKEVEGYMAAIIFAEFYHNFIIDTLRNCNFSIDYAIFIDLKNSRISYRSMGIINTCDIAVKYGGKGNKFTGGHPIPYKKLKEFIFSIYH